MNSPKYVLGVDGGGTKTVGVLADRRGTEVARRVSGASNPNVVGLDVSGAVLVEIVTGCCADAGCTTTDIGGAVFGLAGAGSAANRQHLLDALHRNFTAAFPAHIDTDARIALEGAFTGAPGIAVIAGTGSVIVGKSPREEYFLIGGWGRTLGDDGSGYFVGIEAARAFARILDGLLESPLMTKAFSEKLGWTSRAHLIAAVYTERLEPSTLAPLVLDLAVQNDQAARDILRRGALALSEQILFARTRFTTPTVRVATIGGLIDKPTIYREILTEVLDRAGAGIEVCMPDRPAAEGAVLMARKMGGEGSRQ